MAALIWLLIPVFAAVGAGIWSSWAGKSRTIGDLAELNGYARFRDAMERPVVEDRPESDDLAPASGA